ncbi:MAG: hypothetical protein ABSF22_08425 [Bryobacteraceae bacterium]
MNIQKFSMFGTMLCLLGLGFSDTATGQTLTASPKSPLSFTVQSGGATATQTVSVTASNGSTTLFVDLENTPSWLTVNNLTSPNSFDINTASNGTAPLSVTVNTSGLTTGQVYDGTFTVQINGLASSLITYEVVLTVGNPSLLSANPAALTFTAIQGSSVGTPSSTPVIISSSGATLGYLVSVATQNNSGNWILLTTESGTTNSSVPGFTVQVNPSLLAPGTYTGTVTVQSTTTADSVTIPVTLSVTAGSALNVTGTLNNFIYQFNSGEAGYSPETQSLMISTTNGTLNYQVGVTFASGPVQTTNWLLAPTGGLATTTPQPVTLSLASFASVAALTAGTYVADVTICPTGGGTVCPSGANTTVVPVTLIVSNDALLHVNTSTLSFSIPFGTVTSQSTLINVTSSGTNIPYTVTTNQPWLTVIPASGTTPSAFSITVNAENLNVSANPYVGVVTVFPNNADFGLYNIPITVSLTVTSASTQIYAGPAALLFDYETTQAPPSQPQLVQLTSPTAVAFTVSTTTTGPCPAANWLNATASQNTTPATLSISVTTSGTTAATCTGAVVVTYNNGVTAGTTLTIPVTVDIAAKSLLTVTPDFGFGVVTATYGSTTPLLSRISVNSTDGSALSFSASASTPGAPVSWLFLASSSGTTQQYIEVEVTPSGLPVGVYNGSITISATNSANLPSGSFTLPVVLTVSANTTVSVSPTSLSFTQAQGATPSTSQAITLTATGGSTTYTASITPITGGDWLAISQSSVTVGSTPSTVTASVAQNTLSPGTYHSSITLTYQSAATPTTTIPVTLTVTAAQTVTVSPTALSFSYQLGSAAPTAQTLNVTSTGGAIAVTVAAASSSGWLSVTPASGTTGASGGALVLTASVVPASLTTAQTYSGTITITPAGQSAITIPVTLTVTGFAVPVPATIANSASGAFGAIAPGELITIKGTNIGPATAASFTVATGNTVSNTLSGVQVLFDGIAGTPIYVSATQINVIVPYEIAGRSSTNVVVSYQGQLSAAIPQNVANVAPGIYTFSATGAGQAAALNQNLSLNGPSIGLVINGTTISTTPAAPGSVIVIYMTGGGLTNPVGVDGSVTPSSPLEEIPLANVSATINGVNAPVQFAGAAPGEVTGVIQMNITVPAVTGDALPIVITINGVATPAGPTVAVQ